MCVIVFVDILNFFICIASNIFFFIFKVRECLDMYEFRPEPVKQHSLSVGWIPPRRLAAVSSSVDESETVRPDGRRRRSSQCLVAR